MAAILHLLVHPPDPLTSALTTPAPSETDTTVIDLTAGDVDYHRVLEAIFAAETVATW